MSNFGRVYYANLMSSPVLAAALLFAEKERALLAGVTWGVRVSGPLALSCIMGVAMSHASYLLRSHAAATTAAVVGIACKLLSVVLNLAICEQPLHAALFRCVPALYGVVGWLYAGRSAERRQAWLWGARGELECTVTAIGERAGTWHTECEACGRCRARRNPFTKFPCTQGTGTPALCSWGFCCWAFLQLPCTGKSARELACFSAGCMV
jgi:hypothetical protein